jgi:G3E family GTPase
VNAPIPVTVIGGYLGAGKTTLLNHILREADERIAVLVNDFGSINVDKDLIVGADGDTIELANGCICCSLANGFSTALDTVLDGDPLPARVVIEASGVADPATVAAYGHRPGLTLDGTIVAVDAEQITSQLRDRYVGDMVAAQLRGADLLVLTKTDLVDPDARLRSIEAIRSCGAEAPLVESGADLVRVDVLIGLDPPRATERSPVPDADAIFETMAIRPPGPIPRAEMRSMLDQLPDTVVRVKGFVEFTEPDTGLWTVHKVGSRVSVSPAAPGTVGPPRLVAIGLVGSLGPDGPLAELA